jgi:RNA polymerase sigma-70 factor, ECF subfamily
MREHLVSDDPELEYSDQELMHFILKRKTWALDTLFKRYGERGIRFAQRAGLDADLAQDIVVEAFWRIWTQANRFEPLRGSFGGWFYRIVHNLAVDELRRARSRSRMQDKLLSEYFVEYNGKGTGESLNRRIDAMRVQAALDALPEQQRRALQLAYIEGLSRREISRQLGIPLGTIHTRVRLGKEKLRQVLGETLVTNPRRNAAENVPAEIPSAVA